MAQVALHSPLFGYANNYDFIKLSSTLGVWPDEPGVNPLEGHWSGPLSHYRTHGERDRGRRYLSSEILLVAPALGLSKLLQRLDGSRDHRFDLRMLGATKALFFALAAALLT